MEGQCSKCPMKNRYCNDPKGAAPPDFCSTKLYEDALTKADGRYADPALRGFAQDAARQEAACYERIDDGGQESAAEGDFVVRGKNKPVKPRILEVIEFCHRQGFQKIGFAFCGGLAAEAAALTDIFTAHGLQLVSVICKVGARPKESLGLKDEEKISPGAFEPMCNPIAQAMILNEAGCQFNVVLGLCVGHDSLFLKHSDALCTVLAVKDRLLGHNPLAALYTSGSYYRYLRS